MPILGNYLIEAGDEGLLVSATDLDKAITVRVTAEIADQGRVSVHAPQLRDLVGSLGSGSIELSRGKGPDTLDVVHGATRAHVRGNNPDDFPPLKRTLESGTVLRLESSILREAIERVVIAAASDDSRPVLAGVQLHAVDDTLSMAAADGFRMSVQRISLAQRVDSPVTIIVPARALRELVRVLPDSASVVELIVSVNATQLLVTLDGVWLTTRLIDGTFPDLQQIIPREWSTRTVVRREELLDAARRAAIFARNSNDVVRLEVIAADGDLAMGQLVLTGNAADTGDIRDDLEAQVEGGGLQIAFNGRYLQDVLGVLKTASVAFELQGPNAAGIIRAEADDQFTHVIMPMVIGAG